MICTAHPILFSDQIENNEIGGECSMYGVRRGVYSVLVGKPEEGDHLEDPSIAGRIILRWIFRKWDVEGMDWTGLVQDKDRWQALVNVVMNL